MERKLRTCSVCRTGYKFCPRCNEDKDKELWYFTFCSENCKNIYDITSKYENKQIDTNEAKLQLDKLDLSKLDNFGTSYKNSINEITNTVSTPVKTNNMKIALEETETIEEIVGEGKNETNEEVIEEEKVLKKSRNKRIKNDVEE